jgi:hypothetical protein
MITRHHQKGDAASTAIYSACETYRYTLTRDWGGAGGRVTFVMLNPSTATEVQNDPTVERCERRARTLGYGAFRVCNIFAVRGTAPLVMRAAPDPVGPANDAAIVEGASLCCTHHDAFRFFTPAARPLNRHQPTRDDVPALEQAGCLHANMDLYKWATKLGPWIPAELTADCFALARDIRELDMRASPYDLRTLGFAPVPVETPAGRAHYEAAQRAFTARAAPLRARLIQLCEMLLAA